MDAAVLALAGLARLGLFVGPGGRLGLDPRRAHAPSIDVPRGLLGTVLEPDEMLAAPGQGALGIEVASRNTAARDAARALNHANTWSAVLAEREFLRELGGGCAAPVSAHGRVLGHQVELRVAVESDGCWWTTVRSRVVREAAELGKDLAAEARRELGNMS